MRYAYLPANTLQVRGESVCATLRGMLFQPCFNLERTGDNTFRGAISGFGFAYFEFTRHGRTTIAHSVYRSSNSQNGLPLGLRPSIAADNN